MEDKVIETLKGLGYEYSTEDKFLVTFYTGMVVQDMMDKCNQRELPPGLENDAVYRICGEFLFAKRMTGNLDGFKLEQEVVGAKIGDTQITFSEGDSESARLDILINALRSAGKGRHKCYRKIKWN